MVEYKSSSNSGTGYSSCCNNGCSNGTYDIKSNPVCCGSFSRGQRCSGCPNG